MPVFALLCCFGGGSLSDAERDRFRFESVSGIPNSVFKYAVSKKDVSVSVSEMSSRPVI